MKLRVGGEGTYEYLSTLVETLNFRFLAIVARGKSRRNGRADWWSKRENRWSVLFVEVLAKRRAIIKKKKNTDTRTQPYTECKTMACGPCPFRGRKVFMHENMCADGILYALIYTLIYTYIRRGAFPAIAFFWTNNQYPECAP